MSTGPRTAEGKAISSQNSTRHGLTARTVVTKGENAQEYDQFHCGLLEQYCRVTTVNYISLPRQSKMRGGFDVHTASKPILSIATSARK